MMEGVVISEPGSALPKSRIERSDPPGIGINESFVAVIRGDEDVVLWFLGGVRLGPAAPIVVMELGRISIFDAADEIVGRGVGFFISEEVGAFGAGGGGNSLRKGFGDVGIELDS